MQAHRSLRAPHSKKGLTEEWEPAEDDRSLEGKHYNLKRKSRAFEARLGGFKSQFLDSLTGVKGT